MTHHDSHDRSSSGAGGWSCHYQVLKKEGGRRWWRLRDQRFPMASSVGCRKRSKPYLQLELIGAFLYSTHSLPNTSQKYGRKLLVKARRKPYGLARVNFFNELWYIIATLPWSTLATCPADQR
jgi:hypothetical protein